MFRLGCASANLIVAASGRRCPLGRTGGGSRSAPLGLPPLALGQRGDAARLSA
jgi:hypothetical protein